MKISLVKDSLVTDGVRRMWDGIRQILDIKDLPGEFWKPIKDYEGYFEISTFFRVRSLERIVKSKGEGVIKLYPKIMKQRINAEGYWQVRLSKNGKRQCKRPHRMYAQVFVQNPEDKPFVNHKNLIKTDNIPCNIEWNTQPENTEHARVNGAIKCGTDVNHSKLTENQVLEVYNSKDKRGDIAKKYGINTAMVDKIKGGRSWVSVTGGIPNLNPKTYPADVVISIYKSLKRPCELVKEMGVPMSVICRIKKKQSYKKLLNGLD